MPDDERHGLVDVDAQLDRGGVVGQNGDADGLVHLFDGFDDGLDEPLVQIVDGTEF